MERAGTDTHHHDHSRHHHEQMDTDRTGRDQVLATTTLEKTSGAKTSDFYRTEKLPHRFENPEVFEGYNHKPQNLLYRTTSMGYGSIPPTVDTVPTCFRARTNKFSEHLGKCGMYRNEGLNTSMESSGV
ncbi:piercer of microtubule wall 2 protein-like [Lytechinus pictus]|uniref:piercer of microtubule wall 2 protein-like n=1 Tax=Lytechinus pictus TaxID=7653 RepID=UPI00240D63B9|nr:piercer of microtubule wall 2 protein-like [Lytechinus pictus]